MRDLVKEDQEHQLRLSILRGTPLDMEAIYGKQAKVSVEEVSPDASPGAVSVGPDAAFDVGGGPWHDEPAPKGVKRELRRGQK